VAKRGGHEKGPGAPTRHSLCLSHDLDIHPEVKPPSVRCNDTARFKNDRRRDDERIREAETSPVPGPQLGGSPGDPSGGRLNRRGKGPEEVVDSFTACWALP